MVYNNVVALESYRGAELSPAVIENPSGMEAPVSPPVFGASLEGEAAEQNSAPQSREEWIEAWMKDIKTFIRNIDVSRL